MNPVMLGVAWLAAMAGAATAQPEGEKPADERKVEAKVSIFADYLFGADFEDSPGDVSLSRIGTALDVSIPAGKDGTVLVGGRAQHLMYSFDGATGFGAGGEPWDNATELGVTLGYRHNLNDHWGVVVGAGVGAGFEAGADFADAITYSGRVAFTYSFSDRATVGLGVSAGSRLEDNALLLPVPIVTWRFADKWELASFADHRGTGLGLAFMPNDAWTIDVRAGVRSHEFRLDDAGPTPDGVARTWHLPVTLGATWKPDPQVKLGANVGMAIWQQYTLDDANGDELFETDADAAFIAGLGVEFSF